MKWSDDYATGVARVDDQHRMIFKMADDFRDALDEARGEVVYGAFLRSLDLYVRTHFGFEDGCMNRVHWPSAQTNREAHAKFVEVLAAFRQRYAANGFDRADARSLVDTIDRWLADHICGIDVQLKGGWGSRERPPRAPDETTSPGVIRWEQPSAGRPERAAFAR